jgi:CheY-like chemotaxis protein
MLDSSQTPLRVLVIDDQATMRSILRKLLEECGITDVLQADSGNAALALLRDAKSQDPDVIISDLYMEDMDGMSFCNAVRRDEALRDKRIPILILTGETDRLMHQVARQVGALKILTKPISAEDLNLHLQEAIGFASVA